jgi:hypothetical protein
LLLLPAVKKYQSKSHIYNKATHPMTMKISRVSPPAIVLYLLMAAAVTMVTQVDAFSSSFSSFFMSSTSSSSLRMSSLEDPEDKEVPEEYHTVAVNEEPLLMSMSTPPSGKIQFHQDKDGMMLESPCVMPQRNDYVPIPSSPKKRIRYYQKNDGISLDATPQQSVPTQPNPFRQLETYKRVSFVQDSSGNMVLVKTKPTTFRQVSSEEEGEENEEEKETSVAVVFTSNPTKQYVNDGISIDTTPTKSVPKPTPTKPLTYQYYEVRESSSASQGSPSPQQQQRPYVNDGISIDTTPTKSVPKPTRMVPLKLVEKQTPPSDNQWQNEARGINADSGLNGPKQPTLLWEQRPKDYY